MNDIGLNSKGRDLGPAKIRFFGRIGPLGHNQEMAHSLGRQLRIRNLCSVLPPDEENPEARHKVVEHQFEGTIRAEGMVLRRTGEGVIFTSRDCPIVTVVDHSVGSIGVVHAGLESLLKLNPECATCDSGVLENLLAAMGNPYGENLMVYVCGGISAKNFPNDSRRVEPFLKKFGPEVFPDPTQPNNLDLFLVIRKILLSRGVRKELIFHDGLCTYDTAWIGSKRAGKEGSNWTYVYKHW